MKKSMFKENQYLFTNIRIILVLLKRISIIRRFNSEILKNKFFLNMEAVKLSDIRLL